MNLNQNQFKVAQEGIFVENQDPDIVKRILFLIELW